jgi:hypothetical protein
MPGQPPPPADRRRPAVGPQAAAGGGPIADPGATNGPVVVLSYAYAGAERVQVALAAATELVCTAGTGIIPLCAAAAETWRRIEGRQGATMSRLAAAAIRGLVTAQVTAILAGSGGARWCELATAPPGAAEIFLQVFPYARFVCVHRSCLDVVRNGVRASPWGLQGQGLTPYLLTYPGNSVAALAAYWANTAEQLIAFEDANREATHRVRYEDVAAYPDKALTTVRAALWPGKTESVGAFPAQPELFPEPAPAEPAARVPAEMIPEALRQRIARLHAELGYPPPER